MKINNIFGIILIFNIFMVLFLWVTPLPTESNQIAIIYYENCEIKQFNDVKSITQINNETGLYLIKYKDNRYGYPEIIYNVTNIIIYEVK